MAVPDLSVSFAGLKLKTPVLLASGTCGYGEELGAHFDLARLGGIVVKSLTREPRAGNAPQRIAETAGGMLNAIGLQNVGVEAFMRDHLPRLAALDLPVLCNVAGATMEEYETVCRMLGDARGVAGIELNVSCPNVSCGGMEFGVDPALTEEVTGRARRAYKGPLLVKLSPNVTDIAAIAKAAERGGADGLSLINTVLGMAIDAERRKPVLSNGFGGLSGPAIKPVALRCIWQVAAAVNLPILGMGGIRTGEDAVEFLLAGATAVAVGTANFLDPQAALTVTAGLGDWLAGHGVGAVRDLVGGARA